MEKEGRNWLSARPWFPEEEAQIDLELKRLELESKRQELETKRRRIDSLERILTTLIWVFVGAIILTFAAIFFEGFHVGGFSLETSVLLLLGGATIGEAAGLLTITISAVLGLRTEKSQAVNQASNS
jgi:hypothetical protein